MWPITLKRDVTVQNVHFFDLTSVFWWSNSTLECVVAIWFNFSFKLAPRGSKENKCLGSDYIVLG